MGEHTALPRRIERRRRRRSGKGTGPGLRGEAGTRGAPPQVWAPCAPLRKRAVAVSGRGSRRNGAHCRTLLRRVPSALAHGAGGGRGAAVAVTEAAGGVEALEKGTARTPVHVHSVACAHTCGAHLHLLRRPRAAAAAVGARAPQGRDERQVFPRRHVGQGQRRRHGDRLLLVHALWQARAQAGSAGVGVSGEAFTRVPAAAGALRCAEMGDVWHHGAAAGAGPRRARRRSGLRREARTLRVTRISKVPAGNRTAIYIRSSA